MTMDMAEKTRLARLYGRRYAAGRGIFDGLLLPKRQRPLTQVGRPNRSPACPECESDDTVATHTDGGLRYHRCRECGARYKRIREVA